MSDLEKNRLEVYVNDMSEEELTYLVTLIPSPVMQEELASRDRLNNNKLSAIGLILNANN